MRGLRALVGIALLALLTACTSSPSTRTPSSAPGSAGKRSFVLGDNRMVPCSSAGSYEAECGTLMVPENRAEPGAGMIELKVVLVPAGSPTPAPDPVFFLTGGPGGAATQSWADAPSLFPAIHEARDIVLVDQRGTGGSNELVLPSAPDVSGLSASDRRVTLERWAKKALEGLNGDLRFYTTAAAADDLDDVRVALGYGQIDLYGSSYGATLAQYYVGQHEAHVRAVVLDSGTLLDVPIPEVMAARSQEALDRVFARCRADAGCHAAFPHPERDLQTALDRLSRHPVRTGLADQSGERVVLAANSLAANVHELLVTGRSGEIPGFVHLAAGGDFGALEGFVRASLQEPDPETLGMFWAIECTEAWAAHDPGRMADIGAGSYFLPVMLEDAREADLGCSLMPRVPIRANDGEPVRSDVPVLLLNGTLDPQDPPANVTDAATELPNSLVIVAPEAHTFGHIGCMPEVVAAFLGAGTVQGLDTSCVNELEPPPFSLSSG